MDSPNTFPIAALSFRRGLWLLLAAAIGVPVSLVWDFSWESTVGIDRFWAPPHALTYIAMALGAAGGLALVRRAKEEAAGWTRLYRFQAPLGGWLALWSALAFVTAVIFDRWWFSAYGLQAGIWHPPQLLKAVAFFVMLSGVWLTFASRQEQSRAAAWLFPLAGGLLLALINIVTLTSSYPNRQHSAPFYQVACATYPVVLVALAAAGRWRWSASMAALTYLVIMAVLVWLLPLQKAEPLTGPIYNPMTHLMPPPFPLLLVVPALAIDVVMRQIRWPERRGVSWLQAAALGITFFVLFLFAQWAFAGFLLSPAADNPFFAGGGKHWPFFLKIPPPARVSFWESGAEVMNGANALRALGWSVFAARVGLWCAAWFKRGVR